MATLKTTFSITSTDLLDMVNLSKTVSANLTIDGDNRQGLTVVKTSTGYLDLVLEALSGSGGGAKKAYVYAKNLDTVDSLIFADDESTPQVYARLAPGEFMFFPAANNTAIKVKSSANTPLLEYLILEVA